MRNDGNTQLIVAVAILLLGAGILGGEYVLVKWLPRHQQKVAEEALKMLPYRNDGLGIEMQVAAGIYGHVESFPGGAKISRPMFWSIGPSLTITSKPNPGHAEEFSPQALAQWQTQGAYENIPAYRFSHTLIMNRDAVLIWQYRNRAMNLTARVISPERVIEGECSVGRADEDLYLHACEVSLRTLKLAGPEPNIKPPEGAEEVQPATPSASPPR